jgi:hypothetical protein
MVQMKKCELCTGKIVNGQCDKCGAIFIANTMKNNSLILLVGATQLSEAMPVMNSCIDDPIEELLDDLADLCEVWRKAKDKGRTPHSIRQAMMKKNNFQVITYTNSSPKKHMKVTHLPTGICVEGSGRSSYFLEKDLIAEIESKLRKFTLLEAN